MSEAKRDGNHIPTLLATSNVDGITPVVLWADPVTHRLLVDLSGSGTVTSVSVINANGISGTVANATTTPAITLTLGVITPTTVNGLTLTTSAVGFTIAGGTTPKTLTVPLDASVSGTNTGDQYMTPTAIKTSNYTAAVGDIVACDISAGSFTVTLPTTPADKSSIRIKLVTTGASKRLTVACGGASVLNKAGGDTVKYLDIKNEAALLQYQSSNDIWYVLSTDAPLENFATNNSGIDAITLISASDISVDTTTRVLTITPPLGYFYYYTDGNGVITKHIQTGNLVFPAFTDTSGIWYFYINSAGTATVSQTKYTDLSTVCTVARILWNATLAEAAKITVLSYDANLNTTSTPDRIFHETYGTIVQTGGSIASNTLPSGTPNVDGRNAVVSLYSLSNLNANLAYTIINSVGGLIWQQDLGNITPASLNATNSALFPIRYQDAGGLAYTLPATRFPFDWNTGTNTPQYITATGTRTGVTAGDFFVYYVYSFQDPRNGEGIRLVSDVATYNTLTNARASLWSGIQSTYLTLNDPAIRPLYRLIFQYQSGYDIGTKKTALREVEDIRVVRLTTATATTGTVLASSVSVVPAGNISSTNAQAALEELDTEKAPLTSPTFSTSINGSYLNVSEILITDSGKNIVSAPVATYPSLTELSYIKGVTSALQSQLNAKGTFTLPALTSGSVLFSNGTTIVQDNNTFFWDNTNKNLGVGTKTFLSTGNVFQGYGTSTSTIQGNVQNASNGTSASSDWIATADTGTNSTNYIDFGINSSNYSDASYNINNALGGYLYSLGGDLSIGTGTATKVIKLHTGGTTSSQLRATISDSSFTVETPGTATKCVATVDATQTLTNKRINPRLVTASSYTTDTGTSLNISTCDQFEITAQAGALLFNSPGGTPVGGNKLIIRVKDNGTARALTWNAIFRALGTALPSTTVLSKTLYLGFIYNATDSKWDLVASAQEA